MKIAVFAVVFACVKFAFGGTFTWTGGASGTVWFNRFVPQGLSVIVR
jgi:hypothetical protein